jgi:hypothetical protein
MPSAPQSPDTTEDTAVVAQDLAEPSRRQHARSFFTGQEEQ